MDADDDKPKSGHDVDHDTDHDEEDEEEEEEEEEEDCDGEDHEDDGGGAEDEEENGSSLPLFRPFTVDSLKRIAKRIEQAASDAATAKNQSKEDAAAAAAAAAAQPSDDLAATTLAAFDSKGPAAGPPAEDKEEPCPDPQFEAGKTLPQKFGDFPANLYGRPIEDLDEFYHNKYTFMIVARDKTLFRFSATNAFFILSPFHPIRRAALFILTHPVFSLIVMVVILVNCVFMAINREIYGVEPTFTAIYTCEGLVKMLARGFIMTDFTYLRDAWNWLDFTVVALAYVTFGVELGNVAVLRTFRVLRALKTVAVVPGLKTIVGALMEAVRRLRDVMILSVFVLSIFALVGLQLYQGSLRARCIRETPEYDNMTVAERKEFDNNEDNWIIPEGKPARLCMNGSTETTKDENCPVNYTCRMTKDNPDYGFTNFDNFGWGMLCAFRLMTQDAWENLYQQVIHANGRWQMLFFVIVIFLGSFYLVNVILAIVAMSYDDCRKEDARIAAEDEAEELELALLAGQQDEEEDENEREALDKTRRPSRRSHSNAGSVEFSRYPLVRDRDQLSLRSENAYHDRLNRYNAMSAPDYQKQVSISLPGSPYAGHRLTRHRSSQFSWKKPPSRATPTAGTITDGTPWSGSWRPVVIPCLDNLDLPYADDSTAVTPSSDDLCNSSSLNTQCMLVNRPRLSSGGNRMTQLESRFTGAGTWRPESCLLQNPPTHFSRGAFDMYNHRLPQRVTEPTHFHWNASTIQRNRKLSPEPDNLEKKKDQSSAVIAWTGRKEKAFLDNPFICRTPSAATIDLQDVLIMKDLTKQIAGKKPGLFGYEKGMNKKEFLKEKCMLLMFGWECTPMWYKFAHIVELFIMDAFVDLFITLCIVVNTVFMAMEHYDMHETMISLLTNGNLVFTGIFTVEAGLKVLALGLYKYLQDKWSCFDFVIVILSLVELGLANVKGLSILRSFRLLRVFKLAKSWPTLNLLISIIGRTMGALGNLCFVLAIIIFIFAVMGMQVFGTSYDPAKFPEEDLRWHFIDFLHSFMIVFRILCGEWIENMWGCIRYYNMFCIPFFLLTMIIGNLVVLNLFLALLLSSFGAETLKQSEAEEGPNKLQEAIDRINRFIIYIKSHLTYCFKVKIRRKAIPIDFYFEEDTNDVISSGDNFNRTTIVPTDLTLGNGRLRDNETALMNQQQQQLNRADFKNNPLTFIPIEIDDGAVSLCSEPSTVKMSKESPGSVRSRSTNRSNRAGAEGGDRGASDDATTNSSSRCASSLTKTSFSSGHSLGNSSEATNFYLDDDSASNDAKADDGDDGLGVNVIFVKYPDECCPRRIMKCPLWPIIDRTMLGKVWWKTRCYAYALVEHRYFETFIIVMILASSLALAVEDRHIHKHPDIEQALKVLDKVFTVIFVFEMAVKMMAYGFKKYFTDAWCWLDFVIVAISLIGWSAEASSNANNMGAFRALRTLRALRPLRAVSRWEGMKVVVNALIQAIPAIFNVLLVCLVFWLIFSIMGVNLFMGKFGTCLDGDGVVLLLNNTLNITNKVMCLLREKEGHNVSWYHPDINFDNVLGGYLALFQVATFKGWMPIMYAAIDSSTETDGQPERESKTLMYIYFVLFIVFGSFFTLNLFIGVIIENFNMQKKKAGGSLEMLMTEDQKKYYNAMKKLGSKQPTKPIPKPRFAFQLFFFKLTKNQKFDVAIMFVILLNMFTMAIEHYDQHPTFTDALKYVNAVFIVVFTMECIMKLLGLRLYYFKEPWNVFDFIVVVVSILTLALQDVLTDYLPISPTLLRVVRVFRVGRVLRLVKGAKGIRTLLFSLAVSMPALFNIGLLLFLVMFIYSIVGMSSFMHVKRTNGIDDMFNFETFFSAMIVLFQTCTSAGWDGVLAGLMNDKPPGCDPDMLPTSDCGNSALGIMYLVSYLVISFLVIVNMYIAVILENFSQATEDVQQGLTQDDFDMYYETWEKFDEKATQYIPLSQLSEFVDTLEDPLRLQAPNLFLLVAMDLPICEGDRVHCVDILDALTKHYLGTASDEAGELGDLKGPEKLDYHPVSSMLKRQRETFVARLIQRTWRNHVRRRKEERAADENHNPEKNDEKGQTSQQTSVELNDPISDDEKMTS